MIGPRRIYRDRDLLKAMRDQRLSIGMTMEEVSDRAGVCDRYYNKVEIGLHSDLRRQLRAKMLGRNPLWGSTVRRPFRMCTASAWALEQAGLALVVVPLETAEAYREMNHTTARRLRRELPELRGDNVAPLQVRDSVTWLLGAMGLALVTMELDEALWTVEPDPVTNMERQKVAA